MTTSTNIGHFLGNIRDGGGDTRLRRRRGENFAPEEVLQEVKLARAEGAKKKISPEVVLQEMILAMRRRRGENFAPEVVPCPRKSPPAPGQPSHRQAS